MWRAVVNQLGIVILGMTYHAKNIVCRSCARHAKIEYLESNMKKKFVKKPRRQYPSSSEIEKANLSQLEKWRDTLTYPGHGINVKKDPKKFATIRARELRLSRLISQRIITLTKGDVDDE